MVSKRGEMDMYQSVDVGFIDERIENVNQSTGQKNQTTHCVGPSSAQEPSKNSR